MGLADNIARKAGEKVVVPPKPTTAATLPKEKVVSSTPAPGANSRAAAVAAGANGGNRSSAAASGKVSGGAPTNRAEAVAAGMDGGNRSSTNKFGRTSGAPPLTTEQVAKVQAQALAKDNSGLMTVGRTAAYLTPVIGTAYAAMEAVGGAQTGDANKALMNSVAAVLPMGLSAAGKVASKVAPQTTAKVTGVADRVAAKVNTKIVQPVNSLITSVTKTPNAAADAAQKIVADKAASIRAVDKAAKNLPKAEAKAAKDPRSVVSEAEGILKNQNKPGSSPSAPNNMGGGFGGGRPKGPTLNYGPTGGVASVKSKGVQRIDYIGAGRTQGFTQTLSGGRSLSGAQGAPRAQGVMNTAIRNQNGATSVAQSTATLTRDPAIVTNFGTRVETPTITRPTTRPTTTPPTTRPTTTRPTTTPAPAPAPTAPNKPVTTPTRVPTTTPGAPVRPTTVPNAPQPSTTPTTRPDVDSPTKPKETTVPGSSPAPGSPTAPKVDNPTVTRPTPSDSTRPQDGVSPQPGGAPSPNNTPGQPNPPTSRPTNTLTNRTSSSSTGSRFRLPKLPAIDGSRVEPEAVQSDWQDFRGSTTSVIQKPVAQGGPAAATFTAGSDTAADKDTATKPESTDTKEKGQGQTSGRSYGWMYKNPTD